MAKGTLWFGVALIVAGAGAFFGTGQSSITALIPAFFGLPLALLGWAAGREQWRKHAMHAAVAISLLGLLGTIRALPAFFGLLTGAEIERPVAVVLQGLMVFGFAAHIGFGVRSFIEARRQRSQPAA